MIPTDPTRRRRYGPSLPGHEAAYADDPERHAEWVAYEPDFIVEKSAAPRVDYHAGMVLYHGSHRSRLRVDRGRTAFEGIHVGTRAHAEHRARTEARPGDTPTLHTVEVSIANPKRVKDEMGHGFWYPEVKMARAEGHDGIVYLNRAEIPWEDFRKLGDIDPVRLTDAEFKARVPSAQDSYIAFSPKQVRVLRSEPLPPPTPVRKSAKAKPGLPNRIPGGKADKARKKRSDFDPEKVAEGARIEREHTSDQAIAEEIARDHLTEDPEYYRKLKQVEKSAEPGTCPTCQTPLPATQTETKPDPVRPRTHVYNRLVRECSGCKRRWTGTWGSALKKKLRKAKVHVKPYVRKPDWGAPVFVGAYDQYRKPGTKVTPVVAVPWTPPEERGAERQLAIPGTEEPELPPVEPEPEPEPEAEEEEVPVFTSGLRQLLLRKMPPRATKAQVVAILKDAKQEEVDWGGVDEWLREQDDTVERDALLAHLAEAGVVVEEVERGLDTEEDEDNPDDEDNEQDDGDEDDDDEEGEEVANPTPAELREQYAGLWWEDDDDEGWPRASLLSILLGVARTLYADEGASTVEATGKAIDLVASLRASEHANNRRSVGPALDELERLLAHRKASATYIVARAGTGYLQVDDDSDGYARYNGAALYAELRHRLLRGNVDPSKPKEKAEEEEKQAQRSNLPVKFKQYRLPWDDYPEYRELLFTLPKNPSPMGGTHWDEKNVVAHARLSDVGDMLFIEEIQSDVHKPGKEVQAPFAKTYHEMVFKRLLRTAVDEGKRSIGWTTGAQQTQRWTSGMRQVVQKLEWRPFTDAAEGGLLSAYDHDGKRVITDKKVESEAELVELVGKEMGKKLLTAPPAPVVQQVQRYTFEIPPERRLRRSSDFKFMAKVAKVTFELRDAGYSVGKLRFYDEGGAELSSEGVTTKRKEIRQVIGDQNAEDLLASSPETVEEPVAGSVEEVRSIPTRDGRSLQLVTTPTSATVRLLAAGGRVLDSMSIHGDPEYVQAGLRQDIPERFGGSYDALMQQTPFNTGLRTLEGQDIVVGGSGFVTLYDKKLVQFANQYTKKWGGQVEDHDITSDLSGDSDEAVPATIHKLKITDAMKEALAKEPQMLFARADDLDVVKAVVKVPAHLRAGVPVRAHTRIRPPKDFASTEAFLREGTYGVITSQNPGSQPAPIHENRARLRRLHDDLTKLGYDPLPATGFFRGNREQSFIVPGLRKDHGDRLAKRYGQSSWISRFAGQHRMWFSPHTQEGRKVSPRGHFVEGSRIDYQRPSRAAYTQVGGRRFSMDAWKWSEPMAASRGARKPHVRRYILHHDGEDHVIHFTFAGEPQV